MRKTEEQELRDWVERLEIWRYDGKFYAEVSPYDLPLFIESSSKYNNLLKYIWDRLL